MAVYNPIKLTALPASPVPNAVYYIKSGSDTRVKLYVTDSSGTAFPVGILTEQDILDTELAGYSVGTNTVLESTDSILNAFRKVQGQINSLSSAVAGGIKVPDPIDCSTDPNYPPADAGDSYLVTVAGKIGGASGIAVQVGDKIVALTDNGGGTQAAVGSQWFVIQGNVDKATESVDGLTRIATEAEVNAGSESFAYVTPLRLRGGVRSTPLTGYTIGANTALAADDSILVAFGKVQAQIDAKQNSLGFTPEDVANKSTSTSLGTSNTLYPTQNAVKSYVDTGLAGKEDAFTKNTAFNKNFGTTAGTVAEGNDSRFHAALTLGTANGLSLTGQQLSLGLASTSTNGALSSTDWNIFNNKFSAPAGTTLQYIRGNGSLATLNTSVVTESGSLYFTEARVRASVLTGYSVGSNTALSATDSILVAFGKVQAQINAKQNTLTNPVTGTGSEGRVAFWTGAGTQSGDGQFVWNNTTKRFGVGISSLDPISNLDVSTANNNALGINIRVRPLNDFANFTFSTNDGITFLGGIGIVQNSRMRLFSGGIGDDFERWSILFNGIFQSKGAQTIQTSTGALTLQGNGGDLNYNAPNGQGDFMTLATNSIRRRTAAQVRTEIVTWTEIGW